MDRPNRRQQLNKLRQKEILDELRQKRNKLSEKRHIEPDQGDDKYRNNADVRIFSKRLKKASDKHCKGEPESLSDKACYALPVKEKGKGITNLIRHSREIVESMNRKEARFYTKHFVDDNDEISEISLMYPGWEGLESFVLATLAGNKDKDNEYLPMNDLKSTINLIIDHVLADDIAEMFKASLNKKSAQSAINNSIKNRLLDELYDGIQRYNKLIMDIRKNSGKKLWAKYIIERNTAEPRYIQIVNHVIGQTYDRIIGPRVERLTNITSNLDLNYGELNADFIHDIIIRTKIKNNTVFVDLGSGIGNTILYASIATGCMGYGYELRQKLVDLANEQYEEIMTRGKLYGLEIGRVEFLSGDFRDIYINHPNFINILYSADVILANNRTFSPETNQFLYNLFLGLKKGAKVVSLESFEGFEPRGKQSERVFSNIKQFRYRENWVSWTHSDGKFYIATHV
ncbi:histone methylation protein DOT1-domain-containing protein [Gigaspora rosea]|uniref:Histone-lysine N-methyltransferase, H3 lysine-79 specific n=1 Tax=Gigaspora rosea TaxID=44941 RepID=A0A397VHE1_9GLOM|nr:histone methylation protein DOT1-domain-containing protein [Gigaspora rosea]